jgi:cytochrome c553
MKLKLWAIRALIGGLALLVVIAAAGLLRFQAKATRSHRVPDRTVHVENTPAQLARGEHLARTLGGCTECHGEALSGKIMDDNALLRVSAPNITRGRGGVVADYTAADWLRAILHGIDREGRNLIVMPSKELRTFSDQDIAAMIAYMQTVRPVDAEVPASKVSLLGQVVLGLAGEDLWSANGIDHAEPRDRLVTPSGATAAHGEYLIGVCKGCHGPNLQGGLRHGPDAPPSADISARAMAGWSRDQFERLLRQGKRRDGSDVSPAMPWRPLGKVTDEELTAMWLALRD